MGVKRRHAWKDVPKPVKKWEACWRGEGEDLECTQSGIYRGFFNRFGYHLFSSVNQDVMKGFETEEALLASDSVVAEIYRTALEGELPSQDPRMAALFPGGMARWLVPAGKTAELARWGDTKQLKMPWLSNWSFERH